MFVGDGRDEAIEIHEDETVLLPPRARRVDERPITRQVEVSRAPVTWTYAVEHLEGCARDGEPRLVEGRHPQAVPAA